jgi:ketosteroid isomerase-like protein
MHTPHPPSQRSDKAGRGIAATFMIWPLDKRCLSLRPSKFAKLILMIAVLPLATTSKLNASPEEDAQAVAALDTKYQAAVKANDATTMDQILADDFALVTGRGAVFSKADLLDSARKKEVTYERQDEEPGTQKVRVWGDTAVVTAFLWIKSVQAGKPADYKLWFSDTYVRTPRGWRYVFGQASLPLPKAEPK